MATVTPLQLAAPSSVSTADGAIFTVPALTTYQIGRATLANTSTVAATVTFAITTGGATAQANTLIPNKSLSGNTTYTCPELAGAVIPAGGQLRGSASSASVVTFTVSGLSIV